MKELRALAAALLLSGMAMAEQRAIRMSWEDAAQLIRSRKAEVSTTAGARYKGRVAAADAEAITFEGGKLPPVKRADVAEIRLVEYAGNGRKIGKLAGGALGLAFGLVGAVAIGMNETSAHKDRDKVLATASAVAGLPAGLAGGYYLGRLADKEVTVIRIIPRVAPADTVRK